MANFRYRVFGKSRVYAGCADLETAREVAKLLSRRLKAAFIVYDHQYGSGKYGSQQVAWFLHGVENPS